MRTCSTLRKTRICAISKNFSSSGGEVGDLARILLVAFMEAEEMSYHETPR
jgi:hypothetical protein